MVETDTMSKALNLLILILWQHKRQTKMLVSPYGSKARSYFQWSKIRYRNSTLDCAIIVSATKDKNNKTKECS